MGKGFLKLCRTEPKTRIVDYLGVKLPNEVTVRDVAENYKSAFRDKPAAAYKTTSYFRAFLDKPVNSLVLGDIETVRKKFPLSSPHTVEGAFYSFATCVRFQQTGMRSRLDRTSTASPDASGRVGIRHSVIDLAAAAELMAVAYGPYAGLRSELHRQIIALKPGNAYVLQPGPDAGKGISTMKNIINGLITKLKLPFRYRYLKSNNTFLIMRTDDLKKIQKGGLNGE